MWADAGLFGSASLGLQASTHMSELKMEKDIISLKKKKVKKEKQGAG